MLEKRQGYFHAIDPSTVSAASRQLQDQGYVVLRQALKPNERDALAAEINSIYESYPADDRTGGKRGAEEDNDFRYQMFNRSPLAQQALAMPQILETIEPLLGNDCHVIANTCWRNPPREQNQHGGGFWHIDSGPHIPRPAHIPWDERIPYPVFAIGAHIYLSDCPIESGPTGVIPGSHKSGCAPPRDRAADVTLQWQGNSVVVMTAQAGDVALFVSDVWHRRMPSSDGDSGRFFLQVHYGRRDIAQRVLPSAEANQVSDAAAARAATPRQRTLLGLHDPFFYDG